MVVTIEGTTHEIAQLAGNPSLIKGIYEACDQWCMYCNATKHCLVYRCSEGLAEAIGAALSDPLENLGRMCMDIAEAYLASRLDVPFEIIHRADGPTPLEVFAWYHSLAPARVFRAVL